MVADTQRRLVPGLPPRSIGTQAHDAASGAAVPRRVSAKVEPDNREQSGSASIPVLLANGRIGLIRTLRAADEEVLCGLARRTSEVILYRSFFSPERQPDDDTRRVRADTDACSRALVLEVEGQIVAVASAEDIEPGAVEAAFLVEDAASGQGVGTLIVGNRAIGQRRCSSRTFRAQSEGDDVWMLRVFIGCDHSVFRHDHGAGVRVEITAATTESTPQAPERDAARHNASGAGDRGPL